MINMKEMKSAYPTEYFVGIDCEEYTKEVKDIIRDHQHHLPTFMAELKKIGCGLEAIPLKNGRICLLVKQPNKEDIVLNWMYRIAKIGVLMAFITAIVKLIV